MASDFAWVAVVTVVSAGFFAFVTLGAPADRWSTAGPEFGFQVICFAAAALLLGSRRGWTVSRISDPGMLFLVWSGVFLVYPSGLWLRGGAEVIGPGASFIEVVFLAHGLFIVTLMLAFLIVSGRRYWIPPDPEVDLLPSGRVLIGVPLAMLAVLAGVRLLTSGTLLPESNYGDSWVAAQAEVGTARSIGGLGYIVAQVLSKVYFYAFLSLGVGIGLAAVRAIRTRQGRLRLLSGILILIVLSLAMGITSRSGALTVGAIAILMADLVTGRVRWRHILPAVGVGLVLFTFFGGYRSVADQGLAQGVALGYQSLSDEQNQATASGEIQLMLNKDALGAAMFDARPDGPVHYLRSISGIIPSQLLPGKLTTPPTSILLSRAMLGPSASSRGAGVAGSVIADGFRGGGLTGVALSALLLGSLLGWVYRWLNTRSSTRRAPLLKVALVAGYLALGFSLIRGDFGLMLTLTFYNVVVPWVVLRFSLAGRSARHWLEPMPER